MAEVLSKTNLVSSSWLHNRQRQSISFFPKSCKFNNKSPASCSLKLKSKASSFSFSSNSGFYGKSVVLQQDEAMPRRGISLSRASVTSSQTTLRIGKAQKWWEKGLQPNMKEVNSAQDLVDSLLNAGDKLVVVDFFSPGCGGCRALHPKICQFAEMNPDVEFLQVNYEVHKSMCYSLNVHVLPFFRFYRGAHGRLCSFSCTNATIKKFKDALTKHTTDRCSIAPTKGLEEKELLALSANKDLNFSYTPKPVEFEPVPAEPVSVPQLEPSHSTKESISTKTLMFPRVSEDKTLVASGR
ncbi:thioredoxin-like 1-1, chloroplastic [Ziziphus jujuba]|uniref:Thioredoxin-like 1-1, chloroplastic n=2 Tax=Ziziphus jujuba TaxID=326968 RepID=A0A6P3YWU1_ZIZJJ|nr:thioredoxin-like 1-1, chloroplastic [Ziziphus jujuba]KAH7522765.1 hypothetical protein FEM48_Zijuj07G0173100 [Ziziphus jujuba var. spinosa]